MLSELRGWSRTRLLVAAGITVTATAGLLLASGLLHGGPFTPTAELWWAAPLLLIGSLALGALIASYLGATVGAEATFCDLRWPLIAVVLLHLSTDFFSVVPLVSGPSRLLLGAAATLLLVWAIRQRVDAERQARNADDAVSCTTCRPLFRSPATTTHTKDTP